MTTQRPRVVGLGGTPRDGSSSENALRVALAAAEAAGAETFLLCGRDLNLPLYDPSQETRSAEARNLIERLRDSDGVIIASPGYHGSISGLVKNALDYVEDMREDRRPYLEGRAVGCIVCAYGWQATGTTLTAMRSVAHALRGWPTPLGVAINSAQKVFNESSGCVDPLVQRQLVLLAQQVVEFACMRQATVRARPLEEA
jgi:FMN reductase